jgi:hypothetical protein
MEVASILFSFLQQSPGLFPLVIAAFGLFDKRAFAFG